MSNQLTQTKRPRIQSKPLPIDINTHKYEGTINQRLSKVYRELGIKTEYINKQVKPVLTHDERMDIIRNEMSKIIQ